MEKQIYSSHKKYKLSFNASEISLTTNSVWFTEVYALQKNNSLIALNNRGVFYWYYPLASAQSFSYHTDIL